MLGADQAVDYWRYSILFGKLVDGRFDLWGERPSTASVVATTFHDDVDDVVKRRIVKWKKQREKKLFGVDKPDPRLLH
jgi:hypothetical protein